MLTRRFGRKAPRYGTPKLFLGDYLQRAGAGALPKPPATADYTKEVSAWPMMLNDQLGDCVIATMGHLTEVFSRYGRGKQTTPTDKQVLTAYEQIGGYNPKDPSTDQGCVVTDALTHWAAKAFAGKKIAAWAAIHPANANELKLSTWLFGGVFFGVALPDDWQQAIDAGQPWNDTHERADPNNGHAIPAVAYNATGPIVVTWGQLQQCSWAWIEKYAEEAYCVLSPDWDAQQIAPSGFDKAALLADFAALATKFPPPLWGRVGH
jgi:hypothetical protein